jgi:uncharacterized membrane protein
MSKNSLVKTVVATVVTAGLALTAHCALAKSDAMKMEKCYGVAKAGKNDCGGKAAGHACQGQGKINRDVNDWILVPQGTCDKIVGGALEPAKTSMNHNPQNNSQNQNS